MGLDYKSPFDHESTETNFRFTQVSEGFKQPTFQTGPINEKLLLQRIKQNYRNNKNAFYFDRNQYQGFPEVWEDFKKMEIFQHEAVSTAVNRYPFEQKKVTKEKNKIRFDSRMNIRKGLVSLQMGLGFRINYHWERVDHYLFMLYEDTENKIGIPVDELIDYKKTDLVLYRKDKTPADKILAIELRTSNLDKFFDFAKYGAYEIDIKTFLKKEIIREHNLARKDHSKLRLFYEIVPVPLLGLISDEDLAKDLFLMLYYDSLSDFYDTSDTMLSIMFALSDYKSIYQYAKNYPDKVIALYNHMTNVEQREMFCNFLTAICLLSPELLEHSEKQYVVRNDDFKLDSNLTELFVLNPPKTIYLHFIEKRKHLKSYIRNAFNKVYYYEIEEVTVFEGEYHPLEMMHIIPGDGTKWLNVPAIYIKHLSDKDEWEMLVKAVIGVVNVISIFISMGVIAKGVVGLLRLFAFADIAISSIDLFLANDELKEKLKNSSEAGAWFVNNWPTISLVSSLGMITIQLSQSFLKYSSKLKSWFTNNGHAALWESILIVFKKSEGAAGSLNSRRLFSKKAVSTPKQLDTASEEMLEVEKLIKNKKIEHGRAFDEDGIPLHPKDVKGNNANLEISISFVGKLRKILLKEGKKPNSIVFTHNHPSGSSLSVSDLYAAIKHDFKELRAINPDGTVYSLIRKESSYPWKGELGVQDFIGETRKEIVRNHPNLKGINPKSSKFEEIEVDYIIEKLGDMVEYIKYEI